ncbi:hypothetical protein [Cyclobacterium qasimii]|uniref:Uncharacterized protein n=2 Tax=Cyclobacterium qasimii TaxID=1350429 RepID=S7VM61_9BACT|nr:hypothetical protein [Cyclobacterium qasimii]EPR71041.1 hypothetical protein ADICYQ_0632 [Cyclobacterium qasimii M12-11B]GEO24033.1 hypothetical protein CQA01_45670 [Cyclobacterium qasimii]
MKYKIIKKKEINLVNKFYFLEDIQNSLRNYCVACNLENCPEIISTNFKYHAEIHDIKIIENGEEQSMLELFKTFSLIVIPENEVIKIFLTTKDKSASGYNEISNYLKEFEIFLKEKVEFTQGDFNEIILMD